MKCSTEILQAFLDGELGKDEKDAVHHHLACCPACRQELGWLKMLWLELEQDEEIEIPFELPFIRQQVIARTRAARHKLAGVSVAGYLDTQKLAWQPALAGVAQIPGPRQLMRLARFTGRGLPAAFRGVSSILGVMIGRRRDRP